MTMLHHGFHAAGQAVGHPTGHVSIVHSQQPALEDPAAAASNAATAAGAHMFAATPIAQGTAAPVPIVVSSPVAPVPSGQKDVHTGKGIKRPGNPLSPKSDDAVKKSKEMDPQAEKPRISLTRHAAILPVEAPPPEGVFGKPHNPFAIAPNPHQNV